MRVQSIDSKMPFKFCRPRAGERAPEGWIILIGAMLTFWVPAVLFSVVVSNLSPLTFMLSAHALGLPLGLLLHGFDARRRLIELPLRHTPAAVNSKGQTKKAA